MVFCSISQCGNSSTTCNYINKGITFHRFPQDANIKYKWISATGKRNWFPTTNSRICSLHFTEDNYNKLTKRRTLIKNAVPTVNTWKLINELTNNNENKSSAPDSPVTSSVLSSPSCSRKRTILQTISTDNQQIRTAEFETTVTDTPRKKKLRAEVNQHKCVIKEQRLKIKRLQCKTRRYRKTILRLKDLIKNLEDKRFINGDQASVLEGMNVTAHELIGRFKQKLQSGKTNTTIKYSANLRSFAMSLHFYSPKAYEFVRQKFNTCLPHTRTIKKWYQSINAEPGFTMESLTDIKVKVQASKHVIICNLVLDEMAIRQRVEWDGHRMHGYVDIGLDVNDGTTAIAKEALVFLITSINGAWKIPVGYFLVDGLTGEQKANLVLQCLELLHSTGIEVLSMTFDGCPAHMSMSKKLGCSFDLNELVTNFPHPITKKPVYIFLDACHMMKLVRNSFQASGSFMDSQGKSIKWSDLVALNKLQEKEYLHLANKLRQKHIFFKNQKMKVRLATQLMSQSVANALKFCAGMNHPDFIDVDGTVNFLEILNNLFDILNSRHMNQLYFKKPLHFRNKDKVFAFLDKAEMYLKCLKLVDGRKLVQSAKKTGFLGLLVCIKSLKAFYITIIEKENKLHYLPSYKFSQDHLELTFGHIRAHGGCNSNPTARQFKSIYKKIITHIELKDFNSGNCVALENIAILNCTSAIDRINTTTLTPLQEDIDSTENNGNNLFCEYDYDTSNMSEFASQVVTYIAGSVVHYLMKKIKCDTCVSALLGSDNSDENVEFIKLKDNGGLLIPSKDVIIICKKTESLLRNTVFDKKVIANKNFKIQFINKTLQHFLGHKIFDDISFHQYDQSPIDNHVIYLIKCVVEKYMGIRLNYYTKNAIEIVPKRQLLNKYLHFTGQ